MGVNAFPYDPGFLLWYSGLTFDQKYGLKRAAMHSEWEAKLLLLHEGAKSVCLL